MSANPMIIRRLLLITDPAEFEGEALAMHEQGVIDRQFMQWLDDCVDEKTSCGIDQITLRLIRDELRNLIRFPPEMPPAMQQYYETKIIEAIASRPMVNIPAMVAELKERNLLTEDFCTIFRSILDKSVDIYEISQLQANCNWEALLEAVGPEMAAKVDF